MTSRLPDSDLAERALRLKAVVWPVVAFTILAMAVAYYLVEQDAIGPLGAVGVVALGGLAGLGVGLLVFIASGAASSALVHLVSGAGDLEPRPSYSFQESLVARGRYGEAADAYRNHLVLHPADHEARLALAELHATHLEDAARAEGLYLEVRTGDPSDTQERRVAEGLIDLYHRTGQRGREMAELSRFADRYRGTKAGAAARLALLALKRREP